MLEGQKGKKTNSKLWSFRKLEPARSHYDLGLGNSWTAVIYSWKNKKVWYLLMIEKYHRAVGMCCRVLVPEFIKKEAFKKNENVSLDNSGFPTYISTKCVEGMDEWQRNQGMNEEQPSPHLIEGIIYILRVSCAHKDGLFPETWKRSVSTSDAATPATLPGSCRKQHSGAWGTCEQAVLYPRLSLSHSVL